MNIAGRPIGTDHPVFIVAEVGASHGGEEERAHTLVDMAAEAGADAVKFQLYRPEDMTMDSGHAAYRLTEGPWAGERLWDLYERAKTPVEWLPELFAHARESGVIPFCTPFSPWGVEQLEELDCPAYKIASMEVCRRDLIEAVAETGKPVIASDGCWTQDDRYRLTHSGIRYADLAVLHCVSDYPARPGQYSLRFALRHWWQKDILAGLSDHTTGKTLAIAATALGVSIIEKHIRLEGTKAPDDGHAVGFHDFRDMHKAVRETEEAMAGNYPRDTSDKPWARRLVFREDMPAGYLVRPNNVVAVRCKEGFTPPLDRTYVTNHGVKKGDPVTMDSVCEPVNQGAV